MNNIPDKPIRLQPFPYQGSKRALAPKIFSHLEANYSRIIEPFAGSAAMVVFASYHQIGSAYWINDSYVPLIDLWKKILNNPEQLSEEYEKLWNAQLDDPTAFYMKIRSEFNLNPEPAKLLYLLSRCAKNAVRFNGKGEFNQSPDKRRLGRRPELMRQSLMATSELLKGKTEVSAYDFEDVLSKATKDDLVYLDPPYQGTSNGANTRYHMGLSRERLITALEDLRKRGVPFVLSYDGSLGEKQYGDPLPVELGLVHTSIAAGRSAQSTLNGRIEQTVESLYVTPDLVPILASA